MSYKLFKIIVRDLILYGYHGVLEEERENGQDFLFNITVDIEKGREKESFRDRDYIENTLNYSEVIRLVKEINNLNKFRLLETFSEVLANKILDMSPIVKRVRVRIEKPSPPIKEKLKSVGVEFEIEREEKPYPYYPYNSGDESRQCSRELTRQGGQDENFNREYFDREDFGRENFNRRTGNLVYLSLGSNVGDREKNLRRTVNLLGKKPGTRILAVSSIYETEPMYVKDQDSFYNIALCAEVSKGVTPFEFLGLLKGIEYEMGRNKVNKRYGPRIIDIDILYYDDISVDSDFLTIPHPKIKERNFVLAPLSELSPNFIIDGENIREFIQKRNFVEKVVKVCDW